MSSESTLEATPGAKSRWIGARAKVSEAYRRVAVCWPCEIGANDAAERLLDILGVTYGLTAVDELAWFTSGLCGGISEGLENRSLTARLTPSRGVASVGV